MVFNERFSVLLHEGTRPHFIVWMMRSMLSFDFEVDLGVEVGSDLG